MTFAALLALSKNRAARWAAGVAVALLCLWLARCSGARSAEASGRIRVDDSVAALAKHAADNFDRLRVADSVTLAGMTVALDVSRDSTQRQIARANALADRLSVVKVGTITVVHRDSASAPSTGLGAADEPPDSVKFAGIQRQGDARVYIVPQFAVDAFAELRKALTSSQSTQAQSDALLVQANRTIADDVKAIAARDTRIAALADAEKTAKSSAGRDCRLLPFIPCPSRKIAALGSVILGGLAGYELAHK